MNPPDGGAGGAAAAGKKRAAASLADASKKSLEGLLNRRKKRKVHTIVEGAAACGAPSRENADEPEAMSEDDADEWVDVAGGAEEAQAEEEEDEPPADNNEPAGGTLQIRIQEPQEKEEASRKQRRKSVRLGMRVPGGCSLWLDASPAGADDLNALGSTQAVRAATAGDKAFAEAVHKTHLLCLLGASPGRRAAPADRKPVSAGMMC